MGRWRPTAEPFGPDEAVSVAEALEMYTSRAAFVDHREQVLGSIAVGRLAGMTIVDRDPWSIEPARLADTRVLRTVVGGRTVHEARDEPAGPARPRGARP